MEEAPVSLVTHVNNNLHSFFSKVEVHIKKQQIYNSNGLYAHKSYLYENFKGALLEYKRVLHYEGYDYEKFPDEIMEAPLSEPFSQREWKCLVEPMVLCCMAKGAEFFTTTKLLYPNWKIRLRLIKAKLNLYMISGKHVSLAAVDCSLYTRGIALTVENHRNRMEMFAYTP